MFTAFLLAAAAQTPSPPTPVRVAEAQALLRREAEANRKAMDSAINHRLLGSGYFRLVTDKAEQRSVVAGFQRRLRSIGIAATVGECDWMGLVAQGVKNGNLSYGAACRVGVASRPPTDFLICDASLGGISLIKPDWYAGDADYVELFIRKTCL